MQVPTKQCILQQLPSALTTVCPLGDTSKNRHSSRTPPNLPKDIHPDTFERKSEKRPQKLLHSPPAHAFDYLAPTSTTLLFFFIKEKRKGLNLVTAAFPALKNCCLFTSFSPAKPKSALIFLELPMGQKHAVASFIANKVFTPFSVKNPAAICAELKHLYA